MARRATARAKRSVVLAAPDELDDPAWGLATGDLAARNDAPCGYDSAWPYSAVLVYRSLAFGLSSICSDGSTGCASSKIREMSNLF